MKMLNRMNNCQLLDCEYCNFVLYRLKFTKWMQSCKRKLNSSCYIDLLDTNLSYQTPLCEPSLRRVTVLFRRPGVQILSVTLNFLSQNTCWKISISLLVRRAMPNVALLIWMLDLVKLCSRFVVTVWPYNVTHECNSELFIFVTCNKWNMPEANLTRLGLFDPCWIVTNGLKLQRLSQYTVDIQLRKRRDVHTVHV